MAKSIEQAKRNYAKSATKAEANYLRAKQNADPMNKYQQGLLTFLGTEPSSRIVGNYIDGMKRAQYRAGNPDEWERRYRRAMSQ